MSLAIHCDGHILISKMIIYTQFNKDCFGNCWFASNVTAAVLVVKNKSISLRWEMNSILMQI